MLNALLPFMNKKMKIEKKNVQEKIKRPTTDISITQTSSSGSNNNRQNQIP